MMTGSAVVIVAGTCLPLNDNSYAQTRSTCRSFRVSCETDDRCFSFLSHRRRVAA